MQTGILATAFFLVCLSAMAAETDVDLLIAETGVEAGRTAVRELPGWRPPEKVVIRRSAGFVSELAGSMPGIGFVSVDTLAEAIAESGDADAVVGFCSDALVEAAPRLVWIQIFSAGAEDCLAVDAVASGDILLTNMQKMSSPVIAEHAVAMMLALTRGLAPYARVMQDGDWNRGLADDALMMPVAEKTLLVAGLGGIGTAVAERAAGLGMRVLATRYSSRDGPGFVEYVGLSHELHELAARADVVVNALPLTPGTEGLFDDEFFSAARRGLVFVNVARGGSVVTEDLVAALRDGRVAAAGLDVTDPEPLPGDHPLWQMQNVIITPHVAGFGGGTSRHFTLLRENIRRYAAGEPLLNVVDPERGY